MPVFIHRFITALLFLVVCAGNLQAKEISLSWTAPLSEDAAVAIGKSVSEGDGPIRTTVSKSSIAITRESEGVVAKVSMVIVIDDQYYRERVNRELPVQAPNAAGVAKAVIDTDRWLRDEMAMTLNRMTEGLNLKAKDRVAIICNLASNLPYEASARIYKLPVQSLYEEKADCMDKALLALWLLKGLNYVNDGLEIKTGIVGVQKGAKHAGIILDVGESLGGGRVNVDGSTFCITDVTGPGQCHLGQWVRRLDEIEVGVLPGVRMQSVTVEW